MSGKPSTEGIRELRQLLDRLAAINVEAESLNAEIEERHQRLTVLKEEHAPLAERLPKMLEAMDIAQRGNYGWEARILWALRELATQYRDRPLARAGADVRRRQVVVRGLRGVGRGRSRRGGRVMLWRCAFCDALFTRADATPHPAKLTPDAMCWGALVLAPDAKLFEEASDAIPKKA